MESGQVSFSGNICEKIRRDCESRLREIYYEVPFGAKVLCHVSDRKCEYSGALFVQFFNGIQLSAYSIADDPVDIIDELILNIEKQLKYQRATSFDLMRDNSKVLIVDDDPESIILLQQALDTLGQSSDYIQNPYDAIDAMVYERYKLSIVDMKMPNLTGIQMLSQAESKLEHSVNLAKWKKRPYMFFSSVPGSDIMAPHLKQFEYFGHLKKQQHYQQLMQSLSQTLSVANGE